MFVVARLCAGRAKALFLLWLERHKMNDATSANKANEQKKQKKKKKEIPPTKMESEKKSTQRKNRKKNVENDEAYTQERTASS